jgi:chlorinating enzyme
MPRKLSDDQVEFYRGQGYVYPLRAIDTGEAGAMRESLDAFEREEGYSVGSLHFKGHLCFRWSWQLTRRAEILDAVEDVIGPDILVFASKFWIKGGGDGSYVSWHQDSAYFGLEPHDLVAAWVAITDSTPENGCMRVIPGSHRGEAHSHVETFHEKNLLARGQAIEGIDESAAVDVVLRAGEFSLHHERILHGSLPNQSDGQRIGLTIFYIPTSVRSTLGRRTASLVRGVDDYGFWDDDPEPKQDRDPDILAHMRAAHTRYHDRSVAQEAAAEHER